MTTPGSLIAFYSAFNPRRWSPQAKRKLKLIAFGSLGVLLIGVLGFFAHLLHLVREAVPFLKESGLWPWIIATFISVALTAILVWLEFRNAWKQT